MTQAKAKQRPISMATAGKRDMRTQFGALCYRLRDGKVEVLLITSRGTGRWIIPKGWPMDGETPAGSAAVEAFEEAGVEGKLSDRALGFYAYTKRNRGDHLPCVVAVFPLKVQRLLKDFPERQQRRRKWFSQKKAASMVSEPDLSRLIKSFNPSPGR